MMNRSVLIALVSALACGFSGRASAEVTLVQFSFQPEILKALYREPSRLLSGVGKFMPNGAVAANAESFPLVNVESQRWGADLVQAALANQADPNQGIQVILYGLGREQSDGSFGPENDFQHISFFLEATARTLILLKESGEPKYSDLIAEVTPKLERAAKKFVQSGNLKKQEDKGKAFTHRYYLLAATCGEISIATQDRDLGAKAEEYAERALGQQREDGTNPEKGGFDINYNAASGLFAERYYCICPNSKLKAALKEMLRRTLAREAKAVLADGSLSDADSTRTGKDTKHDGSGQVKGFDHKSIIQFFSLGGAITDDKQYSELAKRIAQYRGWWD